MKYDFSKLEKYLAFNFNDRGLLIEALTHRSYKFENNAHMADNQRLEFLGDAILELILSEYLFSRYPEANEGTLTKIRAALANEIALTKCAKKINLGNNILLGKSELQNGGELRPSNVSDAYEALIAAIYLDQGYNTAKDFHVSILESIWSSPEQLILQLNPKGYLQELTQRGNGPVPQYTTIKKEGPEHQPSYLVECHLSSKLLASGRGTTIKNAQEDAAKTAIEILNQKDSHTHE
jgi:ribonuclease III